MGKKSGGVGATSHARTDGSHGSVLGRIAGGRLTFLRFAIKLQKENAAVLRSFVLSSDGSGSTRKKSNVVGSLPPIASRLQTIIRPLNCARDNNSTSKGAAAAAAATASMIIFQNLFLWEGNETAQRHSARPYVVPQADGLTAVGHPNKSPPLSCKIKTYSSSLSPSLAITKTE